MSRYEKLRIFLMGMVVAILVMTFLQQTPTEAQTGAGQNGRYQISATTIPAKGATTVCAYIIDTQTGQYVYTTQTSGTFGR
jgi:hypothetical protein